MSASNLTQNASSHAISTEDAVFHSTTPRDIGTLKSSIDSLKFEIQELRGNHNINYTEELYEWIRLFVFCIYISKNLPKK